MKKIAISFLILFLTTFAAFGQSVTLTPTTDKQLTLTAAGVAVPNITGQRSSGTSDAPTALTNGAWMMSIYGRGYNGSGYSNNYSTAINFGASQDFTPTANGSNIQFYTTSLNTLSTLERMRIEHNGNVGIGTTTPGVRLDVNSSASNLTARFNGPNQMYIALYENGAYRGYLGSYAGAAEDVDFGTGTTNTTGKVHLTTQTVPRLTIDPTGNVGIGTTSPNAKLEVNGFSKLGSDAPAIKVKKLTGTTGAAQGDIIPISHGLTSTKILSITVLVQFELNGQYVPHSYTNTNGYQFDFYSDATNIQIRNHPTNSGQILSKPIKIMITYEE